MKSDDFDRPVIMLDSIAIAGMPKALPTFMSGC